MQMSMGAGVSLQLKVKPLVFKLLALVFERLNNVLKSRRFFFLKHSHLV